MLTYADIGNGEPVVFIHGLGSRKEAWIPQHILAKKYRLIIPDLRGHGSSDVTEGLTIKNFALDIIELLEHLSIKSTYVVGLSLGGIVSQELYKQRPNLVKGLILANTTSYIPSFIANSINTDPETIYRNLDRLIHNQNYIEEVRNAIYIRDTYEESAKSAIGLNYYPVLATIDVPTLLIGSTHDRVTPLINLMTMKLFIKNVKTVVFDKTGHMSNIEQRDKFNKVLLDFIELLN